MYRNNRAGNAGGGFFCDNGATCISLHEIYDGNCGGNIYLDGGGSGPTQARFDYLTNVRARTSDCNAPGVGVQIDKTDNDAPDSYSFVNSIFWNNAEGADFATNCDKGCQFAKVIITYSMVQTSYKNNGLAIRFGSGNIASADPLFVAPESGDFHLASTAGHWTANGYVVDAVMSPAIAKADPRAPADRNPERAGSRSELGAYGNSAEASYSR